MTVTKNIVITEESLTIELNNGSSISAPLGWYLRLMHGTQQERNNWRLIGNNEGIHWPDLDEDISIENLLLGKPLLREPCLVQATA